MKLLGLTGDIASGKSSAAALLQKRGAQVIDADQLVRELYSDEEFSKRVAALFGPGVLCGENIIDRRKLGEVVFGDDVALQRLESLVHPAVAALREKKLRAMQLQNSSQVVVLEAVKLLESGQARGCAAVWCITCKPEIQLQRLMEKRGLNATAARARLASQPPRIEKQKLAEAEKVPLIFIENNGTPRELETKIETHWREFLKS
jgi:dephospho-CoA kinase